MSSSRRKFLKLLSVASLASTLEGRSRDVDAGVRDVRSLRLGDARLDIINIGDITLPLGPALRPPKNADNAAVTRVQAAVDQHKVLPMQNVLVRQPGLTLMVDAGAYTVPSDSSYVIDGYVPPPPLAERFEALGLDREEVDHVVFTHRHWDHFSGATMMGKQGKEVPLFPRARHYMQRADWEHILTRIDVATTHTHRVFTVLRDAGLMEIVDGDFTLPGGVDVLATPGETAGHQAVRMTSAGESAYIIGDMIHDPSEVRDPGFMVSWADQTSNETSRDMIYANAASDQGLVIASHITKLGRVKSEPGNYRWINA